MKSTENAHGLNQSNAAACGSKVTPRPECCEKPIDAWDILLRQASLSQFALFVRSLKNNVNIYAASRLAGECFTLAASSNLIDGPEFAIAALMNLFRFVDQRTDGLEDPTRFPTGSADRAAAERGRDIIKLIVAKADKLNTVPLPEREHAGDHSILDLVGQHAEQGGQSDPLSMIHMSVRDIGAYWLNEWTDEDADKAFRIYRELMDNIPADPGGANVTHLIAAYATVLRHWIDALEAPRQDTSAGKTIDDCKSATGTAFEPEPKHKKARKRNRGIRYGTLSADALKQRDDIYDALHAIQEKLEDAFTDFNRTRTEEQWAAVEQVAADYNQRVAEANEWQADVAGEIDAYIESKSEKWQESDRGQQYVSWKEAFEEEFPDLCISRPGSTDQDLNIGYVEDVATLVSERPDVLDDYM